MVYYFTHDQIFLIIIMEHLKNPIDTRIITNEEYNYLMQNIKIPEPPIELPQELPKVAPKEEPKNPPVTGYVAEPPRKFTSKNVLIPGLVTRFISNYRDDIYFKMSLMIPMNTDQVKIEWGDSPLLNPIDVEQQMVTLHGIERIENNRRMLIITNPYDVGTITSTFTTSKSSFYDQHRSNRYREGGGGGGYRGDRGDRGGYGYGYETNKRKR